MAEIHPLGYKKYDGKYIGNMVENIWKIWWQEGRVAEIHPSGYRKGANTAGKDIMFKPWKLTFCQLSQLGSWFKFQRIFLIYN